MSSDYEIAPYSTPQGLATDIVSVVLLSFAMSASLVVLVAIWKLDNKNKLRSRILMALFASHIWASFVFLVSICASLAGHPPTTGSAICEVSAILNESSTWAQYLFCVVVAFVSYVLLLHPISRSAILLERFWWIAVILPCLISGAVTGVQVAHHRAVYVGGFCWNGSTGDTFNELINFIPRAVVFLVILAVYGRLYWYLRKRGDLSNADAPTIPRAPVIDGSVPTDGSQPWESLRLSGLSQIVTDSAAGGETNHDSLKCATSSQNEPAVSEKADKMQPPADLFKVSSIDIVVSDSRGTSFVDSDTSSGTLIPGRSPAAVPLEVQLSLGSFLGEESSTRAPQPSGAQLGLHKMHHVVPKPEKSKAERLESVHSLLTRKAAMLFLLFPLTYLILTVISAARLIDDYVAGGHVKWEIRAISRWALFLQAPLDVLTYGVFAFKVRKSVGREIKRKWDVGRRGLDAVP